jgi:hypothetical protein
MVFAALASACHAGNSRETTCRFEYTVAVRENLIIPELKKNFAAAYVYFDYEKPVITAKDDRVVVQLSATKTLNGRELAFEDLFFVEIDPCGKRVLQSYTSQEYHKE